MLSVDRTGKTRKDGKKDIYKDPKISIRQYYLQDELGYREDFIEFLPLSLPNAK